MIFLKIGKLFSNMNGYYSLHLKRKTLGTLGTFRKMHRKNILKRLWTQSTVLLVDSVLRVYLSTNTYHIIYK